MLAAIRAAGIALSLIVHGTLAYAMLPVLTDTRHDALDLGTGDDQVVLEQGIAIEGLVSFGDAMQTVEAVDAPPVVQTPVEEVKPVEELQDVIASDASTVEAPAIEPVETVQTVEPQQQVAVATQQSSGEAQTGGDAKAYARYLGQINRFVQKAKVNPRSRNSGTVVMRFTVGLDGALLSKEIAASSGSQTLDQAAVAALDRAAPFPPIPPDVSGKPLAFTQPFRFITR